MGSKTIWKRVSQPPTGPQVIDSALKANAPTSLLSYFFYTSIHTLHSYLYQLILSI
jgi:hypothetical protein